MTSSLRGLPILPTASPDNPWHALWALLVGFFMILVDATIVAVANPSIMEHLGADYDAVIWVTSAYLLAYAVPLLLAGRLGDRFGPKNLYLVGLAVFTAASLWCGLAGNIEMLIAARVVQGLGAALLTPQTLSTITRIFPPERRGVALSVWGATAGVATLVGPLAGGVLVDGLGWQWIFIVNVPIGIIGLGLAYWFWCPSLPTEKHAFDVLGVVLSGVGMFLVVFALQEGQSHDWAPWIWGMIAAGAAFVAGFIYWQAVNPNEPLIPLKIFRDNDFSLSNVGIAVIGFAVTAMVVPVFFYAQAVCGLSSTRAALLTAPMAVATGVLAPFVGKLVDRAHPRPIVGFGFSTVAIALTWLSIEMTPTTPIWRLVLPFIAMGVGHGVHLVTAGRHRHPSPAGCSGGRGFRRLQRHPPGRQRARQRQHGRLHDVADQRRDARWRSATGSRGIGHQAAPVPARAVLGRPVAIAAPACVRRAVRRRRRVVPARVRRRPVDRRRPSSTTGRTNGKRSPLRAAPVTTTSPMTTNTSSTRSTGTSRIRRAAPFRSRPPLPRCSRATRATPRFCASTSSTRCTHLPRAGTAVPSRPGTACSTTRCPTIPSRSSRRARRTPCRRARRRRAGRGGRPRRHGRRRFQR